MSTKSKQETLRFPVRKTRSTKFHNEINKKLDFGETTLPSNEETISTCNGEDKISRRKKKLQNQENISSPTKKNCSNGISPNKNRLVVLNNTIPIIQLQRPPLKNMPVVSNSDQESAEKLIKNYTPKKEIDASHIRYSVRHGDSPRRSPRKLNIENKINMPVVSNSDQESAEKLNKNFTPKKEIDTSHGMCSVMFNLGSPRRSPRKLNFENKINVPVVSNFDQESTEKLNKNFTPKKEIDTSHGRCSVMFNLDSPRRSPRKLNFENSPSHLISKLSFSSPKAGGHTIGLHKVELKVYQALKASLTQSCDTEIIGRKVETNSLCEFLQKHLRNSLPGSLYISGAPGTGKTALVTKIMKSFCGVSYKHITLNCMSKTSSKEIFSAIAQGLKLNVSRTERDIVKQIEKSLISSKVPVVIILDEVDQLECKDQNVLYTLFEWPALDNSKLILIGIANMLDLTDRILPRLQSVQSCKPHLLHFPPYSKAEIIDILNQRIKEANIGDYVQVIKPSAIHFLAGKVSAVAGDVRKALDVCRRAVELCEIQVKKQMRLVNRSPSKSPRKLSNSMLKQVDIPQVLSIFNEIYGSKLTNEIIENPHTIPLQQKVLICSLLLILKHAKTKNVNLGQFHEVYSRVCIHQKLPSIEQSEFFSLCTLLEARGMLQVKKTKELRNSKIFLCLNEEETVDALGDKVLLANVLEDKLALSKITQKRTK